MCLGMLAVSVSRRLVGTELHAVKMASQRASMVCNWRNKRWCPPLCSAAWQQSRGPEKSHSNAGNRAWEGSWKILRTFLSVCCSGWKCFDQQSNDFRADFDCALQACPVCGLTEWNQQVTLSMKDKQNICRMFLFTLKVSTFPRWYFWHLLRIS